MVHTSTIINHDKKSFGLLLNEDEINVIETALTEMNENLTVLNSPTETLIYELLDFIYYVKKQ